MLSDKKPLLCYKKQLFLVIFAIQLGRKPGFPVGVDLAIPNVDCEVAETVSSPLTRRALENACSSVVFVGDAPGSLLN